ncbi:MAG: hypothetical protein ACKV2V_27820 [Blastocatellia bacterium]
MLTANGLAQTSAPASAAKQEAPASAESAAAYGTITGQINSEDGPLAYATVWLFPFSAGTRGAAPRTVTTDAEGKFKAAGLRGIAWNISVSAPGYVRDSSLEEENRAPGPVNYRIGDTVNLRMTRGGVITGRVSNTAGEPVIAIRVTAQMTRDARGNPAPGQNTVSFQTDDRGVYRIYGLTPGNYTVVAGTNSSGGGGPGGRGYEGQVPVYYPAATRDTAVELNVGAGGEISGIDIQYRGETGRAVSGKVLGAEAANRRAGGVNVTLAHAATGTILHRAFTAPRPGNEPSGFAIYGLADGEYELSAALDGPEDNDAVSMPRRVTVSGRDVSGVELTLIPLASVSGRAAPDVSKNVCDVKTQRPLEEQLFTLQSEDRKTAEAGIERRFQMSMAAPDRGGALTFRSVFAGRYRIVPQLPDEQLYVRAVTMPAPAVAAKAGAARQTPAPINIGRGGLTLKAGDRLTGLNIDLASGAAAINGVIKVAADQETNVFLIPVEREHAEDLLRYAETRTGKAGSFSFRNLAPGKYWLLAQPAKEAKDAPGRGPRPRVWDAAERARLRREAELANRVIDLQPCQKLTGQVW